MVPRRLQDLPRARVRRGRGALQLPQEAGTLRRAPLSHICCELGEGARVLPREEGDPPGHQAREFAFGYRGTAENCRFWMGRAVQCKEAHLVWYYRLPCTRNGREKRTRP
ncbi:serine/threonine-protein kinase Aurora-3 [Iris pallida]|uniref:Serine/threonine-protein kinase Aurora-3 n=1 Tax=Iris pallida TaxID=29817 RepID=A0AAX6ERW7_IRIPA|nr:serine/threonine-protein kinase Aurora-3 [Iris pallida]